MTLLNKIVQIILDGDGCHQLMELGVSAQPNTSNLPLLKMLANRISVLEAQIQTTPQKPELTVWYGSMPESNGKENWTAVLITKGGSLHDGMTIDRSEYPERVLWAADRVRWLIGEKEDRPNIIDYDSGKRSDYVYPDTRPVVKIKKLERVGLTDEEFTLACNLRNEFKESMKAANVRWEEE